MQLVAIAPFITDASSPYNVPHMQTLTGMHRASSYVIPITMSRRSWHIDNVITPPSIGCWPTGRPIGQRVGVLGQ